MFYTPGEGNYRIALLEVHKNLLGPHLLCIIHPNPPTVCKCCAYVFEVLQFSNTLFEIGMFAIRPHSL